LLRDGEIVSIAPGGVREALFSEDYSLVWNKRVGFARAALDAEVVTTFFIANSLFTSHKAKSPIKCDVFPVSVSWIKQFTKYGMTNNLY